MSYKKLTIHFQSLRVDATLDDEEKFHIKIKPTKNIMRNTSNTCCSGISMSREVYWKMNMLASFFQVFWNTLYGNYPLGIKVAIQFNSVIRIMHIFCIVKEHMRFVVFYQFYFNHAKAKHFNTKRIRCQVNSFFELIKSLLKKKRYINKIVAWRRK